MQDERKRIRASQEAGAWIIEFTDTDILDELSITALGRQLQEMVDRMKRPMVVLDFVNVAHMSSSALGMLLVLRKKILANKGSLCLCNIRPAIREVFDITKLTDLFEIHDSREAALAHLV